MTEQRKIPKYQCVLLWAIYAVVNCFFLYKYVPRAGVSGWVAIGVWAVVAAVLITLAVALQNRFSDKVYKSITIAMLAVMVGMIAVALLKIDPLSVRVDRWSATTYFLEALLRGEYPYGVHTHVSEMNYPSPLPCWHYINLPFLLLGDVGWQLAFFLLLLSVAIYWFTGSAFKTFLVVLCLLLSPAYWWEVAVRSDGLSNMILVFCLILLLEKKHISFEHGWGWLLCVCAVVATTRLSAIIPLAIYLFKPFLKAGWKQQIMFVLLLAVAIALIFAPYVFWDTNTWIFFSRNPFMSETSTGSGWVLLIFVVLGITTAIRYKTFLSYATWTGVLLFTFMLTSLIVIYFTTTPRVPFTENPNFDISYLTLSMPFVIFSLACYENKQRNTK